MDNKEMASTIREVAETVEFHKLWTSSDRLKNVADQLDPPAKVYSIGIYVNTGMGPLKVISFAEAQKLGFNGNEEKGVTYMKDAKNMSWHSHGTDLSVWIASYEDRNNRDKDGCVCPKDFAVSKYVKGAIYVNKGNDLRIFDGKRFIAPIPHSYASEEGDIIGLASDSQIQKYYSQYPFASDLAKIIREWAKAKYPAK